MAGKGNAIQTPIAGPVMRTRASENPFRMTNIWTVSEKKPKKRGFYGLSSAESRKSCPSGAHRGQANFSCSHRLSVSRGQNPRNQRLNGCLGWFLMDSFCEDFILNICRKRRKMLTIWRFSGLRGISAAGIWKSSGCFQKLAGMSEGCYD